MSRAVLQLRAAVDQLLSLRPSAPEGATLSMRPGDAVTLRTTLTTLGIIITPVSQDFDRTEFNPAEFL